jgi:LmbE family N-acetylglucosaminyl deacetylase
MKDSFGEIFGKKERVLVVMGHPDDAEIICGGTIARLIDSGRKVRLVVATDGAKGTGQQDLDLAKFKRRRLNDMYEGGAVLGLAREEIFNLGIPDGELEDTIENIGKIAFHIREFRPDIVITHNPEDVVIKVYDQHAGWVNHRDHTRTGLIACYAAFPYARDHAFFPEQIKRGLKGHAVKEILLSDYYLRPEAVGFDIGNYLKQKKEALSKHFLPDDAEDYISENKTDSGYFELLGYFKIY